VISLEERAKDEEKPFLEQLLQEGARKLLQAAIENEVMDYIQFHKDRRDENGQRLVVRLSVRADPLEAGAWLKTSANTIALGLNLVPFAGIAFSWFIGVLRDRLGELEDRFFATVFLGSGLLFLAMLFASAAHARGRRR
jgi:hypothetical protein